MGGTSCSVSCHVVTTHHRYITTADGKFAKVWDGASFAEVKSLESVNGVVESASYCPEANLLATGGEDMWVHVYDATTLEQRDVCKGIGLCATCGRHCTQFPCRAPWSGALCTVFSHCNVVGKRLRGWDHTDLAG